MYVIKTLYGKTNTNQCIYVKLQGYFNLLFPSDTGLYKKDSQLQNPFRWNIVVAAWCCGHAFEKQEQENGSDFTGRMEQTDNPGRQTCEAFP